MRALKQKAASQKGASITFALLLFLVCAIISSVVIVAATAAAGRMSERAATDQRYYAVSSAAGLLRDDFNQKRITIQYTSGAEAPEAKKLVDLSADAAPSLDLADYPILEDASLLLAEGIINPPDSPSSGPDKTFDLTTDIADDRAVLNCTIREYLSAQRNQLRFEISNAQPEDAESAQVYTLQLVLNASVSQTTSEVVNPDGTKTSTVTMNIEWKLGNIQKGVVN